MEAAFRKPDGEIVIHTEKLSKIYQSRLKNILFLRGLIVLWEALGLGTKYLTMSANYQTENETEKIDGPALTLTLIGSMAVAVVLSSLDLFDQQIFWKFTTVFPPCSKHC